MRHLGSLLLALLLAPATWVLTGIGISKFAEAGGDSAGLDVDLAVGLAAFAGAGLCYALLILPRNSPFGLVLAGLGLLGLVVWRAADVDSFNRAVPADFFGITLALRHPADGYAAVLALPLLGTLFSARRWRRYDHQPAEYQPAEYQPAEYQPAEYAAPMTPAYQTEYPTVPDLPTAGYPPPPNPNQQVSYQQQQPYNQPSSQDGTWPFPNDTETTHRF